MKRFSDEIRRVIDVSTDEEYVHCYIVKDIPYSEEFVFFVQRNLEKPNEILNYKPENKSDDEVMILICQTIDNSWRIALVFDPIDLFQPYELLGIIDIENFVESELSKLNGDKLW